MTGLVKPLFEPMPPFDFVIFGATGDLAKRKLIPALYQRYKSGYLGFDIRIVALGRSINSDEQYHDFIKESINQHVLESDIDPSLLSKFIDSFSAISLDIAGTTGWVDLKDFLQSNKHKNAVRAFYLAVNPGFFGRIAQELNEYDLITENSRIIVEKPLGTDLKSAIILNDDIGKVFDEKQIFRIDHYLGKESVQNLMALRFANMFYEPLWNSRYIESVEIAVCEQVGLEDRASYYDQSGALRDMVQNHLLQLLCLVAMEPPAAKGADAIRDEKLKVLNALAPIDVNNSEQTTIRGQYAAGIINDCKVPSYLEDLGESESNTETFVAIKAQIMNWRWAGTDFYLKTGKRMGQRVSEIIVNFKAVPYNVFPVDDNDLVPNSLVIRLQPEEGVKQWLMVKEPGPGALRLRSIPLDMTFANSFSGHHPEAYERLLSDALRGNQTLFMRRDEVEAAWRWIDPILHAWEVNKQKLYLYPSGSNSIKEINNLMSK